MILLLLPLYVEREWVKVSMGTLLYRLRGSLVSSSILPAVRERIFGTAETGLDDAAGDLDDEEADGSPAAPPSVVRAPPACFSSDKEAATLCVLFSSSPPATGPFD